MAFPLALFALATGTQSVSFAPDFYTLESVAKTCAAKGIPVFVSNSCAQDLYALRLPNVTWESLKEALERDGRLYVSSQNGKWIIDRAPTSLTLERQMLRNYLQVAAQQIYRVYGRAANEYRYLQKVSEQERDRLINIIAAARDPDPLMSAGNQLIYLAAGAFEIPYHSLTLPALLSDSRSTTPFGAWYESDFWTGRNIFGFDGNLESTFKYFRIDTTDMTPDAMRVRAQQIQFATKFAFEPFSASTIQRTAFFLPERPSSTLVDISPSRFAISTNMAAVAPVDEVAKIKARDAASGQLAAPRFGQEIDAKGSRIGSYLLTWAEQTKSQMVAYISPLTDLGIVPGKRSLSSLLKTVNAQDFVEPSGEEFVSNVVGLTTAARKSAIKDLPKFTIAAKGDITVVRNELSFLDSLCSTPAPGKITASHHSGRKIPIAELADHVSSLPMRLWKSGAYASQYQRFCNPVAFRPIAVVWQQSPELAELVNKTPLEDKTTVPFSKLAAATRNTLRREMSLVAPIYDARSSVQLEPLVTKSLLDKNTANDLTLVIQRGEDWATFEVIMGTRPKVWSAKVSNVNLEAPK